MRRWANLVHVPLFTPVVGDYYQGMTVAVPLFERLLKKKMPAPEIRDALAAFYRGERYVEVMPFAPEAPGGDGFLDPLGCNGTNRAEIFVSGRGGQILVLVRLDNLGKGSSGAAVQILNIMAGLDEGLGLEEKCSHGGDRTWTK